MSAVNWYDPVPPAETIRQGRPAASTASFAREQPPDRLADRPALGLLVGQQERVPLVAHHPVEAEPVGVGDPPGHVHRRLDRADAVPPHAEVHVDEDADLDPGRPRRRRQRPDVIGVVDRRLDVGLALEGGQPGGLRGADDEVGDQDVADPGGGHHLRLGDLGHGDPDRPRPQQGVGDRRALERLAVGPPLDIAGPEVLGHRPDVGVERVQVQQERRRVEFVEPQSDRAELQWIHPSRSRRRRRLMYVVLDVHHDERPGLLGE